MRWVAVVAVLLFAMNGMWILTSWQGLQDRIHLPGGLRLWGWASLLVAIGVGISRAVTSSMPLMLSLVAAMILGLILGRVLGRLTWRTRVHEAIDGAIGGERSAGHDDDPERPS